MNLNLLKTFRILAGNLSFTATARELRTVQPAVSRHIRALESELGYALFDRSRRQVALTPEGLLFLHRISRPLRELDDVFRPPEPQNEPEGTLQIGSTPEAGAVFLWPKLLQLQSRFPRLKIDLRLAASHEIVDRMRSGELQLGFVSSPPSLKSFVCLPPIRDPGVLVQAERTRHGPWQKRDWLDLVVYRESDRFLSAFMRRHVTKTVRRRIRERAVVNSHIAMIEAVVANDWLALMPRSSAKRFADEREVRIVHEDPNLFTLSLCCLDRFLLKPDARRVWDELGGMIRLQS